jgi:hypothetical protein
MADPTFAETMVTKLETLLSEAAGLRSVTVAGQMVTYENLIEQHGYWKKQVAQEQGTRRRILPIEMGGV